MHHFNPSELFLSSLPVLAFWFFTSIVISDTVSRLMIQGYVNDAEHLLILIEAIKRRNLFYFLHELFESELISRMHAIWKIEGEH